MNTVTTIRGSQLLRIAFALVLSLAVMAGLVTASTSTASATELSSASPVAAVEAGSSPHVTSAVGVSTSAGVHRGLWGKTWAFFQCVVGVGVPAGVALVFATSPELWPFVLGRGVLPASVGAAVAKYGGWIKQRCAYALR